MATKQNVVGDVVSVGASSVVLYSEWTLSQTGCGLPAGPYGIVGGIEGISYLLVVAVAAQTILSSIMDTYQMLYLWKVACVNETSLSLSLSL